MAFDLTALKTQSRQLLHEKLAVSAVYEHPDIDEPVAVTVRWHNKLARAGALEGGFDVEVIEGIDRLVFNQSELTAKGLTLRQGGEVYVAGLQARFSLEAREPADGPVNVYWTVAHMGPE